MKNEKLKIIYEDRNILVVDKPAGIVVFPEGATKKETLIDPLLEKFPLLKNVGESPRYGIVHRLDKDTSGILLIAKNDEMLNFLKKEFEERKIIKKYTALVFGSLKNETGTIETLIGRGIKDRKKQKVYSPLEPLGIKKGLRKAKTYYRVLKKFKNYTLIEASPKTGRKHQIRVHLHYIGNPIVGDKIYKFKNQLIPQGLKRQFLHASYIKINLPNGNVKECVSELSSDLREVLDNIDKNN